MSGFGGTLYFLVGEKEIPLFQLLEWRRYLHNKPVDIYYGIQEYG